MTIKTKANVGTTIYFIEAGEIRSGVVYSINIWAANNEPPKITYWVGNKQINEADICLSTKEMKSKINKLITNFENKKTGITAIIV